MASDPDRPVPLSRERIVAAARELLDDGGPEELSLRRLAGRLGVTAPALYAYVADKQDLLAAVASTGFDELLARFDAITTTDPAARLREMALAYVQHALDAPGLFRVMFRFRPSALELPEVDNALDAATAAFASSASAVEDARAAGVIHPDRDADQAALVLWTTAHGSASVLLLGAADGTAREVPELIGLVDEVMDVVLAGLALPPG